MAWWGSNVDPENLDTMTNQIFLETEDFRQLERLGAKIEKEKQVFEDVLVTRCDWTSPVDGSKHQKIVLDIDTKNGYNKITFAGNDADAFAELFKDVLEDVRDED